MGILTRFTDIMKSNINALLDKCEDPAKMIDQTLRDLREDLAEVKKETANIIADAKSADRQVKECEEEITKYTTAAQNALKAGNENDARTLIAKKQQYESNLVSYKKRNIQMYIPSNYYNPSFAFIAANSSSTEASLPFDVYLSARVEAALV